MREEASKPAARIGEVARAIGRGVQLMEVCGTHTVSIFRSGIRTLLPDNVRLISGPGCPVCVTAQRHIDAGIELADREDVIFVTYGDMVRVPGRLGSLEARRARGADVRVVSSAMTAVELARDNPDKQIVFSAVGFETTAPATAAAVLRAEAWGVRNFSLLMAHKLVIPAMTALLEGGDVPLDGFLCPGHVSVIIGTRAYQPIVDEYDMPCVIAGFEPVDILKGILTLLEQVREGTARVDNAYPVAVTDEGNVTARRLLERVFTVADTPWRALGVIGRSGLALRDEYRRFDALECFAVTLRDDEDPQGCRCGEVIQGKVTPDQCGLFGKVCTPMDPVGPCMVSSEGTCSAWYKYGGCRTANSE
jgi:hydrogenase expression/formation protein HypD